MNEDDDNIFRSLNHIYIIFPRCEFNSLNNWWVYILIVWTKSRVGTDISSKNTSFEDIPKKDFPFH